MNVCLGTCSHRPELVRAAGLFLSRRSRPIVSRVTATETAIVERETEDQLFYRRSAQATASLNLCLATHGRCLGGASRIFSSDGLQGRFRFIKHWTVAGTIQERQEAAMPAVRWSQQSYLPCMRWRREARERGLP